jgi:hypothetical protein
MKDDSPREESAEDLNDVRAEESSRGRKRPITAVSLERRRRIRRIGQLLADPNCDIETFVETIRELGLTDESPEYPQLLALWKKRHGNR